MDKICITIHKKQPDWDFGPHFCDYSQYSTNMYMHYYLHVIKVLIPLNYEESLLRTSAWLAPRCSSKTLESQSFTTRYFNGQSFLINFHHTPLHRLACCTLSYQSMLVPFISQSLLTIVVNTTGTTIYPMRAIQVQQYLD